MNDDATTLPAEPAEATDPDASCAGRDALQCFAGIDEAGRGPLAGPVVVAAVVFEPGRTPINGLADSKQLCAERREVLYARIIERALAWHVVFIEADEIDRINIYHATMLGMRRALEGVLHVARFARIDGNALPRDLPCPAQAIVGGDATDRSIMAASILAKVTRDRHMRVLHGQWPGYGFDEHKGYATPAHREALARLGPCPIHRRSFVTVRESLQPGLFGDEGDAIAFAASPIEG
ncbi:ribonuclease HII [Cognatiluteimonas profundi]|uniref:ribonuclease HII n=1 Tax=Cognatiluteimonas profundi TaxID=2594501 RepID=UPI00131A99BB|nr:ribonuclease HII [Lysobacter profundi]